MDIAVTQEQGRVPVAVVRPTGNLTGYTYQEFEERVRDVVNAGAQYLLLDLTDVGYISSAGLRSLNYFYSLLSKGKVPASGSQPEESGTKSAIHKSPYLKLLNPSERALQAIQLVGFEKFFEIYYDHAEALASF